MLLHNLKLSGITLADYGVRNLDGARFSSPTGPTSLHTVDFRNISCRRSVFSDFSRAPTSQEDAQFLGINLNFQGAVLKRASFRGAWLRWDLPQSATCFSGANLDKVNFEHAVLVNANFSGALNFPAARFTGATLVGCVGPDGVPITDADGARLKCAIVNG